MSRNSIWLWMCFDASGKQLGDLEAVSESHALEEATHERPETVRVERIKGSGRPQTKPKPAEGTHRYAVRYKIEMPDGRVTRHRKIVRALSAELAKGIYCTKTTVPWEGKYVPVQRTATSVKELAGFNE